MKRGVALVVLLIALFILGCDSGKLNRAKAEAALDAARRASDMYPPEVSAPVGKVSGFCNKFARKAGTAAKQDVMAAAVDRGYYSPLQRIGAITVETTAQPLVYNVVLTDLAKRTAGKAYDHETFESTCDLSHVNIIVAKYDRVKVTGIVQQGVTAKVDALICRKLSPFGEKFLQFPEKERGSLLSNSFNLGYRWEEEGGDYCLLDEFQFQKYDDGWRLK
jgi:hypothetical protein